MIPFLREGGQKATAGAWPAIKVRLVRDTTAKDIIIHVKDPSQRTFGRLEFRASKALAPLMDSMHYNGMRIRAKLESRKRLGGEVAGSVSSAPLKTQITLFCPRNHADEFGRRIGQQQVLLRDPVDFLGLGIELYNPHSPKVPRVMPFGASAGGSSYSMAPSYVNRTMEEVTGDVMNMFDSLPSHDDLSQKQQDPRVITPLLPHQAQALTFMTDREKDHAIPKDGEPQGSSLWKIQYRPNGVRVFYNILTGMLGQNMKIMNDIC
jgi:hypothetical protein